MPSPIPLPKNLRRVMVSFRVLPALLAIFKKHVPKNKRSQWLLNAMIEKLEREGVQVEKQEE
jgi:hypothetical protein